MPSGEWKPNGICTKQILPQPFTLFTFFTFRMKSPLRPAQDQALHNGFVVLIGVYNSFWALPRQTK